MESAMLPRFRHIAAVMCLIGVTLRSDVPTELTSHSCTPASTHAERIRIQAHLARVERELLLRDVSQLSPEQQAARELNVITLREYRRRGVFPHNHDFRNRRVPYFVDRHGTRCAMAYLIETTGGAGFVRRVAATCNNARIREIAGDPELLDWLEQQGLSIGEAAMIQPEYGGEAGSDDPDDENWIRLYTGGTVIASGLGITAIFLNTPSQFTPTHQPSRGRGAFAFATGFGGLAIGLPALTSEDDRMRGLGVLNTCVGAASVIVGAAVLARTRESSATTSALVSRPTPGRMAFALMPVVGRGPSLANGAALHLRF